MNDDEIEFTDLDDKPGAGRGGCKPRFTPRQRGWSLALTGVLFVLVVGVLLANDSDVHSLLGRNFSLFRPPATPHKLALYLQSNPDWGHFILNGKPLVYLPDVEHDPPLLLAPGFYNVIWQATPFKSRTCTFTVSTTDLLRGPCLFNSDVLTNTAHNSTVMIILFFASLNDLPSDQRVALIQDIQAAFLSSSISREGVHLGELYAASEQEIASHPSLCTVVMGLDTCYVRASQPLLATPNLQLDTSNSSTDPCITQTCFTTSQDCRALCEDPSLNQPGQFIEEGGWNVATIIQPTWSYTTLSGQMVANGGPDSAIRDIGGYQQVSLHIDQVGTHGWHVAALLNTGSAGDVLCNQAIEDVLEMTRAAPGTAPTVSIQGTYDLARPAAGCLEIVSQLILGNSATPTPPAQKAYFLVRFGVVLAANDSAHHLLPHIPVADAYEKELTQQLLSQLAH